MKYFIPLFACLFILSACKKDVVEPCPSVPTVPIKNAYYPLEIGNYWIYEFQSYLPDGTATGMPFMDTLKVIGDTLIDEYTYFAIHTDRPVANSIWYLRDEEGAILSRYGSMVLPPSPTDEIFNAHHYVLEGGGDTLYYYFDKFPSKDLVNTNFGDEECMRQEATHLVYPLDGNSEVIDVSYFASFGPVQRSYAYLSGAKMVGTLVEYHLE